MPSGTRITHRVGGAGSNFVREYSRGLSMKNLIWVLGALLSVLTVAAQPRPAGQNLTWAYPIPDKAPPSAEDAGPKKIPGSARSYTQAQIDDQFNPPDWFP